MHRDVGDGEGRGISRCASQPKSGRIPSFSTGRGLLLLPPFLVERTERSSWSLHLWCRFSTLQCLVLESGGLKPGTWTWTMVRSCSYGWLVLQERHMTHSGAGWVVFQERGAAGRGDLCALVLCCTSHCARAGLDRV